MFYKLLSVLTIFMQKYLLFINQTTNGGGNLNYKTLQPNDLTPIKRVIKRFAIRTYHILEGLLHTFKERIRALHVCVQCPYEENV